MTSRRAVKTLDGETIHPAMRRFLSKDSGFHPPAACGVEGYMIWGAAKESSLR
jgi:hypothetical protein